MAAFPTIYDKGSCYDLYSKLLKERIIMIDDEINPSMSTTVVSQLLVLQAQDASKDITIYINSPGGHVYDCLGIIDTMQYIKPDINTICLGFAASAASVILAAGTKGKRFCLPNSTVMIHQPSGGAKGKCTDMETDVQEIKRLKEKLTNIMSEATGKDYDTCLKAMERDNFLSAEQALEFGIVDSIIKEQE